MYMCIYMYIIIMNQKVLVYMYYICSSKQDCPLIRENYGQSIRLESLLLFLIVFSSS